MTSYVIDICSGAENAKESSRDCIPNVASGTNKTIHNPIPTIIHLPMPLSCNMLSLIRILKVVQIQMTCESNEYRHKKTGCQLSIDFYTLVSTEY